jgi:nucleoside-diphosphate-sugar epimerase
MRVLVTGHNGYIGSAMLPVLSAAGHTLTGLDNFLAEACRLTADPIPVPALSLDIRDVRVADLVGFDAIVHLAGVPDDSERPQHEESIAAINWRGAVHLAQRAREAGVGRFLYASTCSVYGPGHPDEALTEVAPLHPVTPGAVAKAKAEEGIATLADQSFCPVILRTATAYGVSPHLRSDSILNRFVGWAHTTGRVRIAGDGSTWRPLVHVEDIAYAFAAALASPREALHGQVFNLGVTNENYQVLELAEIVVGAVPGSTIEHVPGSPPEAQVSRRIDFGKLNRTLTTFRPRWNAAFGAKDLYATLQEVGVTHEDLQTRYHRPAQLRQLVQTGRVDETLRWRDRAAFVHPEPSAAPAFPRER